MSNGVVENLIDELTRLPGIGRKTAQRLSFFIMGMPHQEALSIADAIVKIKEKELDLKVASEVFADRALNPDGTLVPRSQPGAVIKDPEKVIAASLRMVTEGKATAVNGQEIPIRADTICLHGDTPGVVALARGLRERLEAAGVEVTPMSNFL